MDNQISYGTAADPYQKGKNSLQRSEQKIETGKGIQVDTKKRPTWIWELQLWNTSECFSFPLNRQKNKPSDTELGLGEEKAWHMADQLVKGSIHFASLKMHIPCDPPALCLEPIL